MSVNVFADLHHDDLYYSFHLLFEKALGWKLYRPIGFDWAENGFWKYSENPNVIKQYLQFVGNESLEDGYYSAFETKHDYYHKAITLEQFKEMPIDIVIASVYQHELPFADLIKKYKPKAKLIRQAGNVFDIVNFSICKNIMAAQSPKSFFCPPEINVVFYHPMFDTDLFTIRPPKSFNKITNMMNCYPDSPDFKWWGIFKELLPEFEWKMYGILGEDGMLGTIWKIAKAYEDTTFSWHLKHQGDGYGFSLHHSFACGKPPIVIKKYYKDKLAEELMIDGKTCIVMDGKFPDLLAEEIRHHALPENYLKISRNTYERFKEIVDFEKEIEQIKTFLERLI